VPVGGADGHLFLGAAVKGEGGGLGFEEVAGPLFGGDGFEADTGFDGDG